MEPLAVISAFIALGLQLGLIVWVVINQVRYWRSPAEKRIERHVHWLEYVVVMAAPIVGIGFMILLEGVIEPIARPFMLPVIGLIVLTVLSYWFSRFSSPKGSLLVKSVFTLGVFAGLLLDAFLILQFLGSDDLLMVSFIFPFIGIVVLSPGLAAGYHAIELNRTRLQMKAALKEEIKNDNSRLDTGLTPIFQRMSNAPDVLNALLMFPVLVAFNYLIALTGPPPDFLILAFTQTRGFLFSEFPYYHNWW